ncbi:MAG TPA: serine/threonine-protein kinase [Polyangiales bacterium]|nr:serine/threonine-protein kinase [Polyangiales bacterium]
MAQAAPQSSVWRAPVLGFVVAVAASAFALYTDQRVQAVVDAQVQAVLRATVDTAVAGALPVLETAARSARAAAADPQLQAAGSGELSCGDALRPCSDALARALRPYLEQGRFAGAVLGSAHGRPRPSTLSGAASLGPQLTATAAQLAHRDLVITAGIAAGQPLLLFAVPVPRGVLLLALPMSTWTRAFKAARIGQLSETYAFDSRGRLLSDVRFDGVLRTAGLLSGPAGSALRVELRDPGGDLGAGYRPGLPRSIQPLTRLAALAQQVDSGIEARPYRSYRGVPVVGAFRALREYGMVIACEIDAASAYETLSTLQLTLKWLVSALVLSVFALIAAAVIFERMRRRAETAERIVARFGQYRIVRKIAEGGMGAVYLASHEMLRRPAAIKVLRPDRASPEAIARFEREVRVTATLKHPNTVAVYDYGRTERGNLFYVMEYLEGLDLQNLVTRFGAMPGARVVHFLRQLCGSLSEAHAAQLVHRDIKPANLLACRVGGVPDTLKVVDFGVAKPLAAGELGLTSDRIVLGTPEYMAPELFESSDRASPQSDLYSLGAVSYFLLTGRPVFEARSLHDLCMAQLTREPEPLARRTPGPVDAALETAVMACLAKRPERRPASARALLSLLDRSPLAHAWKVSDAEAWWQAHGSELDEVRASREPASPDPEFTGLRPVARA